MTDQPLWQLIRNRLLQFLSSFHCDRPRKLCPVCEPFFQNMSNYAQASNWGNARWIRGAKLRKIIIFSDTSWSVGDSPTLLRCEVLLVGKWHHSMTKSFRFWAPSHCHVEQLPVIRQSSFASHRESKADSATDKIMVDGCWPLTCWLPCFSDTKGEILHKIIADCCLLLSLSKNYKRESLITTCV